MSQQPNRSFNRRSMIKLGLAAGASAMAGRFSFAAPAATPSRFVFIIMRGALDGLSAVPPFGDSDYTRLRAELAIAPPGGTDAALPLNAVFGLNPGLQFLHESYSAHELLVFHAVATPYRERSHFDGQDVLENGVTLPHGSPTGWLNRALNNLPPAARGSRESGVALAQNVPLVLRGPAPVASWSPSVLPDLDPDTLQRIVDRYASDPVLSHRLADALATDQLASESMSSPAMRSARSTPTAPSVASVPSTASGEPSDAAAMTAAAARSTSGRYLETVRTAAGFLRRDDGPSVAVFETTGWDTHFNEGGGQGQLRGRLAVLDQSLRTLKDSLGDVWSRTAVLVATEFGRTAAANGTRGTDHGTGSAAFLLGGAVAGGRVVADWPGLSAGALYQQRDLKPTLDMRSVMKSVLRDHLRIATRALDNEVFPESKSAPYLPDLLRA
jgi:uncharacterized protein (DUF1501 family)